MLEEVQMLVMFDNGVMYGMCVSYFWMSEVVFSGEVDLNCQQFGGCVEIDVVYELWIIYF